MFVYYVTVIEDLGSFAYGEKHAFHSLELEVTNKLSSINEVLDTIPLIRKNLIKINERKIDREYEVVKTLRQYSKVEYQSELFKYLRVLSFSLLREE